MKGIALGALVGALAMFVWGFVFWGVLPFGSSVIKAPTNQIGFQGMLKAAFDETGVYMVPYSDDPSDTEFQRLHTEGPIAMVYYREEGSEPMAPSTFVMGYLHEVVALLIMGLALKLVSPAGFGGRLGLVLLAGLAGSFLANLSAPIWWLQPWDLAVVNLIYESIAWLLGGLALAAFVKPAGQGHAAGI